MRPLQSIDVSSKTDQWWQWKTTDLTDHTDQAPGRGRDSLGSARPLDRLRGSTSTNTPENGGKPSRARAPEGTHAATPRAANPRPRVCGRVNALAVDDRKPCDLPPAVDASR